MGRLDKSGDMPLLGTWLKLPAGESAEIAAAAGFDFVVIDLEHTMLDLRSAYTLISTASCRGVLPIVRVPDHGPSVIQRVLDAGAAGVLVPHVDTPQQAAAVAEATRFPPRGTRGSGATSRAGGWGRTPRADYLGFGNDQALCLAQLESETAMRNAEAILAIHEVDGVLIGAADLALEMGRPATDPLIAGLIESVLATSATAAKPCGFALGADPDRAGSLAARGFGFLIVGNDTSYLADAMAATVGAARGSTESAVRSDVDAMAKERDR